MPSVYFRPTEDATARVWPPEGFTKGYDATDLKEAKAPLDDLA